MPSLEPLDAGRPKDRYWRSLEQLVEDGCLQDRWASEFPMLAEAIARQDRRSFLGLLGASMALAGLTSTGCRRWPVEQLRPHNVDRAGSVPGVSQHYATLFELGGAAYGILAKSYDGRPIKLEGNPSHRGSLGAASALAQASLLDLYDPDRSRHLLLRDPLAKDPSPTSRVTIVSGNVSEPVSLADGWQPTSPAISWEQFAAGTGPIFAAHRQRQGEGLAVLVHPTSSPTAHRLIRELRERLPKSRWFAYQALDRDSLWLASTPAFPEPARRHFDLGQAEFVVCVDCDLLGLEPGHLKHARDWSQERRSVDHGKMNRLVCIESGWTITGSAADSRLPLKPSQCEAAVAWIAARLGVLPAYPAGVDTELQARLDPIAIQLNQAGPRGLIAAGPSLSQMAVRIVDAINDRLGNTPTCLTYTREPLAELAPQGYRASIGQLSQLLQGNVIQTLVILGGNPVYDGPADAPLDLASSKERPLVSIHLGSHDNETSRRCTWHVPLVHALESWSDGLGWEGTYTLGQPLIEPLYGGKSTIEMLGWIGGSEQVDARAEVRKTFDQYFPGAGNPGWEWALHEGCHGESRLERLAPTKTAFPAEPVARFLAGLSTTAGEFELRLLPDNRLYDGSFANNAWLQELPDPVSKLTWDNAVFVAKVDADRLGISSGSVVRINDTVDIPAMIMPGQPQGCIAIPLGHGRKHSGRVGNDVGADLNPLRTLQFGYTIAPCTLGKTGRHYELATTQLHHVVNSVADIALQHRIGDKGQAGHLVHEGSLEDFLRDPRSVHGHMHAVHAAPLFNKPHAFDTPHRWAMAIDLNACIGCSGCVIACQAENNIPVVGKQNVLMNREMHWIRIDRYFKGDIADPDMVHVPTACAHCENAPCEQVCPVAATVHDTEGVNAMVYNRCIGTRYCSNNCPYKVRRFNYFDFHALDPREPAKPYLGIPDQQQEQEVSTLKKMVHNPDVTVRMRGVMEKCTYCVQRIAQARITAKNEFAQGWSPTDLVQEGEMTTACQATCPTQAIVFGDLNDPYSDVSKARSNPRSYEMLAELNLGARTSYLAKVRNRPS